jgi:predicted exporter
MTSPRFVYLALFILGAVVPYAALLPWVIDHGVDVPRLIEELFANRISTFFALDVIVSAIVLWLFVAFEGRRAGVRHKWAPIAASLAIGVSAGLPLFLYLRESAIAAPDAVSAAKTL